MSPHIHVAFGAADLHIAAAEARLLCGRPRQRGASRDRWPAVLRRRPVKRTS